MLWLLMWPGALAMYLRDEWGQVMHEALMRSFSRFLIFVITALVLACMCCSFAAGQEPIKADDFRPRPNPTIIPNGIDVPKLAGSQPQLVGWPKLNCYLLIVADSDLTEQQRESIKWLFHRGAMLDGFAQVDGNVGLNQDEAKRFLNMVAEEDAKRKPMFATLQPWLAGAMLGAAFLLIMQACREWFAKQSYRDQGLVK